MEIKPLILTTGLNGLVGSRIAADLNSEYSWHNLDLRAQVPVDITDQIQVSRAFQANPASVVIHLAAFTDVTQAWQQKGDKTGLAYRVNVLGTETIVRACNEIGAHLIYLSTAYVFDGNSAEPYEENAQVSPIEWYGQTKAWAEEVVQNQAKSWTILRIDQPFRPDEFPKPDTAHRILNGLKNQTLPPQFTNHWFGPTYIPDLSKLISWTINQKPQGVFHATNNEKWSDFDFAQTIAQAGRFSQSITPGDLNNYLRSLNRPYQRMTALNSQRIWQSANMRPTSVKDAIGQLFTTHQLD